MSYTAKTWRTLNDFKVNDLNSLERGVQEAHEGVDLLRKDFTTTKIAQDKAISQINSLLNQSGSALQAIKDIENILVSDKELSEVLKNYGTEFLSKEPQSLSNDELKNVYKNLKLNEYKLFTSVTINGEEVIGNSLDIKSQELDTILNRSSNNAVTNAAITQALENFSSPDINRYLNIHNESTTAHTNLRDQINSKASIDYVNNAIKNIPVPDVSKQISEHNSDATSHQDIRDMLNNLDLSGYAKEDHAHDDYLPLTAGVDKKVTGSFHVDNYITIANGKGYRAYDNSGTIKELLRLSTGNIIILGDANSSLDIATHGTLRPSAGKSLNLGTSAYNWNTIYGTTIYQNGKQVADKDHTHDYAASDHTHNYATQSDIDNALANIKLPEIDFDGVATEDFVSEAIKNLASTSYVDGVVSNHSNDGNAHSDIRNSVTNIQTSVNTISGMLSSFAKSEDVVKKSGDTMSGTLTLGNITLNPSTNTISTNKLTLTNLSESSSTNKLVVLDSSNNAQYRSLTGLKSDLNITNDINTAIQGVKDWLLGTGNANTIDTIKDIADIMEEHKDVLDTLSNTYALKGHNHEGIYAPVHDHPYAAESHNHTSLTANGTTFTLTPTANSSNFLMNLTFQNYQKTNLASLSVDTYGDPVWRNKVDNTDYYFSFDGHTHSGYASSSHNHNSDYAPKSHTHDYASSSHTHTEYAPKSHTHDYAASDHAHDYSTLYASKTHTHTEYAKISGGNTFTGTQHIKGTAENKPLWVRGIQGCLEDGVTEGELHLNYQSNQPVKWGTAANGQLNADGTITEAGTLLSNKYAPKSHTHSYTAVYTGTSTSAAANTFATRLNLSFVSNSLYIWTS